VRCGAVRWAGDSILGRGRQEPLRQLHLFDIHSILYSTFIYVVCGPRVAGASTTTLSPSSRKNSAAFRRCVLPARHPHARRV
jgi:hypothetical protein